MDLERHCVYKYTSVIRIGHHLRAQIDDDIYQIHASNDGNDVVGMLNMDDDNGVVDEYGWLSLCV